MTGGALRWGSANERINIMAKQVKIVAVLEAKPGKVDDLKALLGELIAASRAEPGNLRYDLWQDHESPERFVLDELYTDDAAVAAHRASPHFQNYLSFINDLAERRFMVLEPLTVA